MAYWWVNQSQSFNAEHDGGFLWAPRFKKDGGSPLPHWLAMTEVRKGDAVLHYASQKIKAISTATGRAKQAPLPASLPAAPWRTEGWRLPVDITDLAEPIGRDEIPLEMREKQAQPMFTRDGTVAQGYLYPVDINWFAQFARLFANRLPPNVRDNATIPAEMNHNIEDLLRSQLGENLHSLTGHTMVITEVDGDKAFVSTDGSNVAVPIQVADIKLALDRLRETGIVVLKPNSVDHESDFISTLLGALPGTVVDQSTSTVSLAPNDSSEFAPTGTTATKTLPASLNKPIMRTTREEQPQLRRLLVGNRKVAACDICGETMPVGLLIASHIKPRNLCTDKEQRDLHNIAMLACRLGCDELYERGYISVDENGTIVTVKPDVGRYGQLVSAHLSRVAGLTCEAFTEASAQYFEYHRTKRFAHVW
ncbi:MAG TPA: hypothetical protein VF444_22025 [Pseudonocardiaceae bacterium]